MASFISSWRCNTLSGRVIELACNSGGLGMLFLSGVPSVGEGWPTGMSCNVDHTHLWWLMWGGRWLLCIKWNYLPLIQRGFLLTSCWSVGNHRWWSPRGNRCKRLFWCVGQCGRQEFLYFFLHAGSGDCITWALCNRVWRGNRHQWLLRSGHCHISTGGAGEIYLQCGRLIGRLCIPDQLFGEVNPDQFEAPI